MLEKRPLLWWPRAVGLFQLLPRVNRCRTFLFLARGTSVRAVPVPSASLAPAGASDVGGLSLSPTQATGSEILRSLLEMQHPSVEAEHSTGAVRDDSDSPLGLLLLLLHCLLLPSLLLSQLLTPCSFTKNYFTGKVTFLKAMRSALVLHKHLRGGT